MLTAKIGESAGLVWDALSTKGEMSTKALGKATKLKAAELNQALGWLAREGKLSFTEAGADYIVALN